MSAPFLKLFGPPELVGPEGAHLPLRTIKQLALLVYLTLEARDRPIGRDRLADLLWLGSSTERGRHSLSQALSSIRERLGPDSLTRRREGVQLVSPPTTDLDALRNGEAVIRDVEPLKDLEQVGSTDFAHWVEATREHLLAETCRILTAQMEAARSEGNVTRVHERAQQLYRVDPTSNLAVYALAERALLKRDQRAAVRLLKTHAQATRETLGARQPEDLRNLLARIERGAVRVPAPESDVHERPLRPELFLGREAELAALEALWAETRGGSLCSCIVVGSGGIGKSALAHRFATSVAARAYCTWEISCQEIGRNVPYAATSELIRLLLRDPNVSGTDKQWLAEASRVVPEIRASWSAVPEPPEVPADSVRIRMSEALLRMLTAISEREPSLLVIDNWQHIDPVSRDVFHVLLRRLSDTPTLLVTTYATDHGTHVAAASDPDLASIEWSAQLDLSPLPEDRARELARRLLTDDGDGRAARAAGKIARLSQGNPYLIEMLVSDWRTNGTGSLVEQETHTASPTGALWKPPSPMRAAFGRQYRGLSHDAQHLVRLLAVAGRTVGQDELTRLVALTNQEIERGILELIDRAIIRVTGGRFAFKNEMHRAFVYYEMSEDARRYHHSRLAESLEGNADPDSPRALEACEHFLGAGMFERACAVVRKAADSSILRGAPHEAERALRAVLPKASQGMRSSLWLLLARALEAEGRYRDSLNALGCWESSRALAEETVSATLLRAEAVHRGRLADDATIQRLVAQAEATVGEHGSIEDRLRAFQLKAEVAADAGQHEALDATRARALAALQESRQDKPRALAHLTAGYVFLMLGEPRQASTHFAEAAETFRALSLDPELRKAITGVGTAYWQQGNIRGAVEAYHEAAELAEAIGDASASAACWNNLGLAYADQSLTGKAVECLEAAIASNNRAPSHRRTAEIYYNKTALAMIMGKLDEAWSHAAVAQSAAAKSQSWRFRRDAALVRADVAIAESRPEIAWPLVDEAIALSTGRERLFPSGQFERLKLQQLLACGKTGELKRVLQAPSDMSQRMCIRDRLELSLSRAWAADQISAVVTPQGEEALRELCRFGFTGCARILSILGILPPEPPCD